MNAEDDLKCDGIILAGHSAGVVAALCAFDFQNPRNIPVEVVTFGAPKVGNAAFASEFKKYVGACTRIVNDNDGITLAPLLRGFHHVGDAIHMSNTEESPTVFTRLVNFARLDSVTDHDIDSYIKTIENYLKKET